MNSDTDDIMYNILNFLPFTQNRSYKHKQTYQCHPNVFHFWSNPSPNQQRENTHKLLVVYLYIVASHHVSKQLYHQTRTYRILLVWFASVGVTRWYSTLTSNLTTNNIWGLGERKFETMYVNTFVTTLLDVLSITLLDVLSIYCLGKLNG